MLCNYSFFARLLQSAFVKPDYSNNLLLMSTPADLFAKIVMSIRNFIA